ncbi:hypothetical protein C8F01DRAFT_1169302 [Mycena amicta]|nr:hypothetical protein C8F01DRAFT_1169302 [Mycena amicta]
MPVTFTVATHTAQPVKSALTDRLPLPPREILAQACPPQYSKAGELRGSSFDDVDSHSPYKPHPLTLRVSPPDANAVATKEQEEKKKKSRLSRLSGLFSKKNKPSSAPTAETPTTASGTPKRQSPRQHAKHHALVLRPDDIWLGILAQVNFFVNANSELLRASFVAHGDKKTLTVTRDTLDDFGEFARAMVGEIDKNVVDPSLHRWVLPDFSTTTQKDTTVASILLMATLKSYFDYAFCSVACGLPRVTLEGEKRDWEKLVLRAEKLKEYGVEPTAWYHLLMPVLSRFVQTFDDPYAEAIQDFWARVAHFERGGSGPDYYSGWISVFCVWSQHGKWMGPLSRRLRAFPPPDDLSAKDFWAAYLAYPTMRYPLTLDSTPYMSVDADSIPPAYAEVDVLLVDLDSGQTTQSSMTAGLIGMEVCDSGDTSLSESGERDVVRPVAGWWLFDKK